MFWPGSVDWDSWGQISQVIGVQEMTAHHTVLSTWLHGWLFRLGRALGSDNLGVFLYIVLQFLVCAWVFGQVTAFAARLGCSRGVQYAVTAFFALNPIWGAFIQTQVKDTLYTGLFVLFVLKTADLLLFPQEWQGSPPAPDRLRGARRALLSAAQKRHLCRCADAAGVGLHRE